MHAGGLLQPEGAPGHLQAGEGGRSPLGVRRALPGGAAGGRRHKGALGQAGEETVNRALTLKLFWEN